MPDMLHTYTQDKKCLESICLCFARLVDQYHSDAATLKKLGEQELLENFQVNFRTTAHHRAEREIFWFRKL